MRIIIFVFHHFSFMKILKNCLFLLLLFCFVSCKKDSKQAPLEKETSKNSTLHSENVYILKDSIGIPNLKDSIVYRKVWLYLPPEYNTSSKSYPVIYMHDAQNLFDQKTSYAGEWNVDETLNEIYTETGKGFIVVGLEHGGKERLNELSPWKHEKYGGGSGDTYLDVLLSKLKPKIDAEYRTINDPKTTAIIGSSMGGLISYYAGLKHPDVFGKVGALSTSFWFSEKVFEFTKEKGGLQESRIYLLVGDKEGGAMVPDMRKAKELLVDAGFNKENMISKVVAGGQHNEALWRENFKEIILWLYEIK